jgi:hypothetical protein
MKTSRRCRNTSRYLEMNWSEKYVEMSSQSRSRMRTILFEALRPRSAIKIFICIMSLSPLIMFIFYMLMHLSSAIDHVVSLFPNTPPSGFPWDLVQRHLQRKETQTETDSKGTCAKILSSPLSLIWVVQLPSTFFPPSLRQDFSQVSDTNPWTVSTKFNYAEYGRKWNIRSDGSRYHLPS